MRNCSVILNSYRKGDTSPLRNPLTDLPLAPSGLPGGKSARKAFLLPQGKLCSAKMLLAAYMPPLRITIRGKYPPDHSLDMSKF